MSDRPNCACLKVSYNPLPTEIQNSVTGKMIKGHMDRWTCDLCGCEYSKTRWHNAVVKQQQTEIERLRAALAESCEDARQQMHDCGHNQLRAALNDAVQVLRDTGYGPGYTAYTILVKALNQSDQDDG